MKKVKKLIKRFNKGSRGEHSPDKPLVYSFVLLLVFGLVMLSSASAVLAYIRYDNTYFFLQKQLIALVIGLILFYVASKIDYHFWRRKAIYFLFASVFLLILVFIPGLGIDNVSASSWIEIFGYSFQPSEFVKIFFLIYLAAWLELRSKEVKSFSQSLMPFLITLTVISVLMLLQPDIGTLSIIFLISFLVYFVAGAKKTYIIGIVLVLMLGAYFMITHTDYQKNRFVCLEDPGHEACYQINQSLIASGSGGMWGKGLGNSRQKFLFLPEVSGDAIFPIISEEIGYIFSVTFIFLYLYIFYRGWLIALRAKDMFGKLLSIGVVSWIFFQAFLNIGGMINLIPMTGVPLPFVSAGGSALLSGLLAMGILINISKHTVED